MKKRKLTPEQRARFAERERRADENLRRAYTLVERGFADLEVKRAAWARGKIELDPAWRPRPTAD